MVSQDQQIPRFGQLLQNALNIAASDGGIIIGLQIIRFVAPYLLISVLLRSGTVQSSLSRMFLDMFDVLTLGAIIFRVIGLTRGVKHSWGTCYQQAVRRWSALLLLRCIGQLVFASGLFAVLGTMLQSLQINPQTLAAIGDALMLYVILAYVSIMDLNKNPLQSIVSVVEIVTHKNHFHLWLAASLLYAIPSLLGAHVMIAGPYFSLLCTVWFLFCNIFVMMIYASITNRSIQSGTQGSKVSVLIA